MAKFMMVQKSEEVVFGRAARRKAPLSRRNMAGQIRFKFSLWTEVDAFGHNAQCHVWRKPNS